MKISNILKIADFETDQLSKEFVNWVGHCKPIYRDTYELCKEHLYSHDDIEEFLTELPKAHDRVLKQLAEIKALLKEADCSYFRIIKN